MKYTLATNKVEQLLSMKQIVNSGQILTITFVITLTLITTLSIFGYFSLDKNASEQNHATYSDSLSGTQIENNGFQKKQTILIAQQLLMTIIILSALLNALIIIRTITANSAQNSKDKPQQVNHDYLTNLLNRRSFKVLTEQSVAISKRYNSDLSVISFDIDHFKSINEQYGQALGDKVIQNVADTIQTNCRESDSVFRFDGDAFLLLLPQTSITDATKLADKIRNKIASAPTFSDKLIIEITATAGVAQWQKQEINIEDALKRAELALTQAKKQGSDLVLAS